MILNIIMILFFFTIGISYNKRFQKYEKFIFITLIIHDLILTTGLITAFFHATKKIQKVEVASCTISMVMVSWFRLMLRKHEKRVHKTLIILTENSIMKQQTSEKVMKRFVMILFFIVLSSVMIFLSPILRFVAGANSDYNDSAIYIVPYLFKFKDVDSLMDYITLVSIQASMIVFNANGCWSYTIFTCYIICNLETYVEDLNKKFVNILRTNERLSKNNAFSIKDYEKSLPDRKQLHHQSMKIGLEEIIRYQQFFHRYLKDFMRYSYWAYVGILAWILFTLILTTFAISQIPKDIFFLMKKVAIFVNFLLVFYLLCYIGEAVSRLDDSLLVSLYHTPWYLLPASLRKNMVTLMIQSQKEFRFNILGMYTINLRLFTSVLKIIYSVTNILIAAQKK